MAPTTEPAGENAAVVRPLTSLLRADVPIAGGSRDRKSVV